MLGNLLMTLIVGGFVGYLASAVLGGTRREGAILQVIVGIIGALVASLLIGPFIGVSTTGVSTAGLLLALLGAIVWIAVMRLIRRRILK